jgi:hypothetical protein
MGTVLPEVVEVVQVMCNVCTVKVGVTPGGSDKVWRW